MPRLVCTPDADTLARVPVVRRHLWAAVSSKGRPGTQSGLLGCSAAGWVGLLAVLPGDRWKHPWCSRVNGATDEFCSSAFYALVFTGIEGDPNQAVSNDYNFLKFMIDCVWTLAL